MKWRSLIGQTFHLQALSLDDVRVKLCNTTIDTIDDTLEMNLNALSNICIDKEISSDCSNG